jgi:hypothetical protein
LSWPQAVCTEASSSDPPAQPKRIRAGTLEDCIRAPSALYNLNRRLEQQKAPGYNLQEFRPGYVLAALEGRKMTLQYKPLEAKTTVEKQFDLLVET